MEITAADVRSFGNDETDVQRVHDCQEAALVLLPPGEMIHAFFISRQGGYPDDLYFFTGSFLIRFAEFRKAGSRGARECSLFSLTYSVIGLTVVSQEKTDVLHKSLSVEIAMKDTENIRIEASGLTAARLEAIIRNDLVPHLRR